MQIYFRDEHLAKLQQIFDSAVNGSNITLITGKRMVGKTTLVKEHLKKCRGVYISVSIKSSALQLGDISDYLKTFHFTDAFIPGFRNWEEFFRFMFHIARLKPLNLVLDEFHNFERIEPEFLPSLKKLWDMYASASKLNILLITNSESLLQRLIYGIDSPLYGIVKNIVHIEPFNFREILRISRMHAATLKYNDIKKLYLIFGGLPKYYYLINQFGLWKSSIEDILRTLLFSKYAPLSTEINNLLLAEFGRENKISLSILQAIAHDKNTVTEIAEVAGIPVTSTGKYLGELEKKRGVIKRKVPLGTAEPGSSKNGKYFFRSYFHNFWFRFVQPDLISYELEMYDKMLRRILQSLDEYVQVRYQMLLQEIFKLNRNHPEIKKITGEGDVTIGSFWTRKATFEIAILNQQVNELTLCKYIDKSIYSSEAGIQQIFDDYKEVVKNYPEVSVRLTLITESDLPAEKLKKFSETVGVINSDTLELLLKRENLKIPRGILEVKKHNYKPIDRKRTKKTVQIEID